MEQLKTELAALVAGKGDDVRLWDFMDYSGFSTEVVPPAGDRQTSTKWFWEPTHFKKSLGRIMIGRMFGGIGPAFGVTLTPANVTERNEAVRAQRQAMVCGGSTVFLTVLDMPIDDACVRAEGAARQRGPT